MSPLICNESLERYANLVQAVIPGATGFALCNDTGQVTQVLNFDGHADLLPAIEQLCKQRPEWALIAQPELHVEKDQALLTIGLSNPQREVIAALAILIDGDAPRSSVEPIVKTIAACIEQEMLLDTELNLMTHELTVRYEELNLVYHTEDQVNYYRQGREALENLTQNCIDYLDVGLAILILRDKGVKIVCGHPRHPIEETESIQSQLANDVYSWIRDKRDILVINNASDSLSSGLLPESDFRVLCCPILESSGDVVGILATVNSIDKPVFTNSDSNLLKVMARKASKITAVNYDALTGLISRNGYEYFLESAIAHVTAEEVEKSLLHINIDKMHIINDTVSHTTGDAVIRNVAALIDASKKDGDILCRLGGDEFGMLMHDCSIDDAVVFAENLCRQVEQLTTTFEGENYKVTVCIGVATITAVSERVAQIIGVAELACSVAKDQGINRVETYRPDNADVIRREEEMHSVVHIQSALNEDRFELYCQPIQALAPDDGHHHTEILMRLINDRGDVIEPGKFIPAAERYHLMPAIDKLIVRKTLTMLSGFDQSALLCGTFAINLSGQSFCENEFLEYIHAEIEKSKVPPECICFELTETAAIAKLAEAVWFMESLKDIGCTFSLDDFGSGISSFGYLKRLPVDYLKIDGEIVKDIVDDDISAAMVVAINQVGHAMKLLTIAEYVENEAIQARLKEIGVDFVQGYAIGKPAPLAERLRELMPMPTAVAS